MIEMSDRARELVWSAERTMQDLFRRVDAVEMANQQRVLEAFWEERVSARHFAPTTGYGYDDIGRDTLDRVFAHALMAKSSPMRSYLSTTATANLSRRRNPPRRARM